MTVATENNVDAKGYEDYEKYYQRACEICVPIVLKVPVYVSPIVIEQPVNCRTNGHH